MNKNNLNPIFVPYDLPIEGIKTKGNYQKTDLYGIPCYNIPPYDLTVDKDKLFYIDFKYEE